MRPVFAFTTALLFAAASAFALAAPTPAEPATTAPAAASTAPPAAGPPTALLDSLVSKSRLYGITKTSGRRYLCRLTSGDHGVYMAQTFHFAGPPQTEEETLPPTQGAPRERIHYRTIGSGRRRVRIPLTTETPGRVVKGRTVTVSTPTTIPDLDAVRMLLAGVAGTIKSPEEVLDTRDLLTPADITYIQELAPPAKSAPTTPVTAPTPASTTAGPANAWTMTTLWPTAKDAAPTVPPAPKKRTRHSRRTS